MSKILTNVCISQIMHQIRPGLDQICNHERNSVVSGGGLVDKSFLLIESIKDGPVEEFLGWSNEFSVGLSGVVT